MRLGAADAIAPERLNTMVEALSRLEPATLQGNPKLQEALSKVLDAVRGTPRFVELVRRFAVAGREADLLELASRFPGEEHGVEAIRLVLGTAPGPNLQPLLRGPDKARALGLAQALAQSNHPKAAGWLSGLVTDLRVDALVRKEAVRGLSRTREGAMQLLAWERASQLPADVRFVASVEMNGARWPEVKAEAARRLPLPVGPKDRPLPPVAELLRMPGDALRGEAVYFREAVGCAKCHQVNGRGTDFGPALSEIGSKLGREGLLESILDPSAGISFGFESWEVQTKDGSEWTGLLVSDAAEELAIKAVGGVVTRIRKSEVQLRRQSKLSAMPAGLAQTLSTQELADLLEYLARLRKR